MARTAGRELELVLWRHGIAVDRARFEGPDRARPLTARGRRRTWRAARGLAHLLAGRWLVITSPARRARETAAILRALDPRRFQVCTDEGLLPEGDPAKSLARQARLSRRLILVGHEPGFTGLAGRLLCCPAGSLRLGKAGALWLRLPGPGGPARLAGAWRPRELRRLGGRD
jgi:phosphohistidine phosphatase